MTFVHPISVSFQPDSRLRSKCFPCVLYPPCGTLLVFHWHREHTTDPLRPLPAHAAAACYNTGHLGDACSNVPLSGDERYAARAM